MRPTIVITLLFVGLAGLGVAFYFKSSSSRTPVAPSAVIEPVTPATTAKPATPNLPVAQAAPAMPTVSPPAATAIAPVVLTPEEAAIKAKLELLTDLQANYDAASLEAIHNELTNTNRIIRHAAIEATTQFRDRASIPVLQDLAARTTDPEEKQELLDAVEFLTIPTYTEVMAERKKARLEAQGAVNQ